MLVLIPRNRISSGLQPLKAIRISLSNFDALTAFLFLFFVFTSAAVVLFEFVIIAVSYYFPPLPMLQNSCSGMEFLAVQTILFLGTVHQLEAILSEFSLCCVRL